jgi:hypothetical protein
MRTFLLTGLSVAAFCLLAPVHAAPPSVNPEPMDLDVETQATISKEKSKRNNFTIADGVKASQDQGSSGSNPCGSVNINSQQSNDKKSLSGISDMFGKQSTTVVTGPVINMANCK